MQDNEFRSLIKSKLLIKLFASNNAGMESRFNGVNKFSLAYHTHIFYSTY